LDREIERRQNRINFLGAEVKALLQQRKASEIYYRNPTLQQTPLGSSRPSMTPVIMADQPPTVAAVDEQIQLRRSWLSWFSSSARGSSRPSDSRTSADLEREIQQREARVAFLRSEVEALLLQRKASEIYYRSTPNPK
jgi:hypothetical protein